MPMTPELQKAFDERKQELAQMGLAPAAPPASPIFTPNTREDPGEKSSKQMRQGAFLAAYEKTGRVLYAAEAAGIDKRTFFYWKKEPEFAAAFALSYEIANQALEDEAVRRAGEGPVMSDRLLIKLLESRIPEVYNRPQQHEHSGPGGKPVSIDVSPTEQILSRIAGLISDKPSESDPSGT